MAKTFALPRPDEFDWIRDIGFLPSNSDEYIAYAPMSFEDWLALDCGHGLCEWVDGEARLYRSATNEHQSILGFVHVLLGLFVHFRRLGEVKLAPYAMESRATGQQGLEPDIMFVATANLARMGSSHLRGAPDLVVEVVSEDSRRRDYEAKYAEYAAAGVREYWIIDSRSGHHRATFAVLRAGQFEEVQPVDGLYRSEVVPGLWLRVDWLWEDPQPIETALRDVAGITAS